MEKRIGARIYHRIWSNVHPVFVEFVVDLEIEEDIMLELFERIEEYYSLVWERNFHIHKKRTVFYA